jgi:nucleotide-binding universal stress UspA family protein
MSIFPTKILLASDGSEDAAVAVRAAVDISGRTGSELHVVHAWQVSVPRGYTGRPLPNMHSLECKRAAGDLLTAQVKQLEATGKAVTEAHLRRGPPVDEILELSEELDVSLIVAGNIASGKSTHRRTYTHIENSHVAYDRHHHLPQTVVIASKVEHQNRSHDEGDSQL